VSEDASATYRGFRNQALYVLYRLLIDASFQVQAHHYAALPMNPEAFAASGFSVWENPLLRAAIALQGNVLAFVLTHSRFYQLAKIIFEQKLAQAETDRILARFSSELRIVLAAAQRSYSDTVQILTSSSSPDKQKWLEELNRLCTLLLFDLDEDATVTLTLETFTSWVDEFESASAQFQKLILEIVIFALDGNDKN